MPAHTLSISPAALERLAQYRPEHARLWQRIAAGDDLTPPDTAQLLLIEAFYFVNVSEHGTALHLAQQALQMGQALDDRALVAEAQAVTSFSYGLLGNFAKAREIAHAALASHAHGFGAVRALTVLALCATYTNDLDEALRRIQEALALSRVLNDDYGTIRALHLLGVLYRDRGEFELSVTYMSEAAELDRRYGAMSWGGPMGRTQIALIRGDRSAARQALRDYAALGPQGARTEASIETLRGILQTDEEEFELAAQTLERTIAAAEQTGEPYHFHLVRIAMSRLRRQQGDASAAAEWARSAVRNAQRGNSHVWETEARIELARALWDLGDLAESEAQLLSALDIGVPLGAQYWAALSAFLLAALHTQQRRPSSEGLWREAARRIRHGGYGFIYERERELAYPLLAQFSRSKEPATRSAAEQALEQLARIPPLPLHIRGLGKFEVLKGRLPIAERELSKRRAGELFRFLLLQPQHAASREIIFEALCPEQTPAGAQTFLHHATSALRRSLEPDLPDKFPSRYVSVEFETVRLRLPSGSSVDFEEFEQRLAAARAPGPDAVQALQTALDGYAGDLFPGDRYADWSVAARERLTELHRRALLDLATLRLAQGDPDAALDLCRTLLGGDPWNEGAVLLGMQACLAMGRRPAALILYNNLERALRAGLQIAPRQDLQQLAASIRTRN